MSEFIRATGTPTEEAPGEPPVCPGCEAVGVYHEVNDPAILTWWWETVHKNGCSWLANPDSEPYG